MLEVASSFELRALCEPNYAVVENLMASAVFSENAGSFDFVRLTAHFAQEETP